MLSEPIEMKKILAVTLPKEKISRSGKRTGVFDEKPYDMKVSEDKQKKHFNSPGRGKKNLDKNIIKPEDSSDKNNNDINKDSEYHKIDIVI